MPILPVAIDGVYKVWARRSWRIRLAKVKLRFGKAFYPRDIVNAEMNDETKYETVINHLRSEIEKMIDEMRN